MVKEAFERVIFFKCQGERGKGSDQNVIKITFFVTALSNQNDITLCGNHSLYVLRVPWTFGMSLEKIGPWWLII